MISTKSRHYSSNFRYPMYRRVLVLGDDSRSCLTIVRSLGRKGIEVVLGVQDPRSLVPYSRFVSSVIRFPSSLSDLTRWEEKLKEVLSVQKFDLIIPGADETLVPLVNKRDEFQSLANLAVPDEIGFNYTYYKHNTIKMARDLDVPIPTTFLVENMNDLSLIHSHIQLQFPLVAKPSSSKVWEKDQYFELQVTYIHDWMELLGYVKRVLPVAKILIQEYFPGVGVGQEFLAQNGVVQKAFQHERVHEPLRGGGSSYRRSTPLDERMLSCSQKMLSYLRWTGVAMVEYKRNPSTGKFVLMEINGRFWGSLPLAVSAGMDFPLALYQLLVEKRVGQSIGYRTELYCRDLERDAWWFVENWTADKNRSNLITVPRGRVVRELFNIVRGNERWDTITVDDPLPGIIELWRGICLIARKIGTLLWKHLSRLYIGNSFYRKLQEVKVRRLLGEKRSVVFLCRGNICRSPFAEGYLKLKVQSGEIGKLEVMSAGTYPQEQRESPEVARLVSDEFGVDLNCHRSRVLSSELMKWAGVVMCMDARDYNEVRCLFPGHRKKLFFLGYFSPTVTGLQITDPWDRSPGEFRLCYQQILSSINGLIRVLRNR